MKKMRWIGCFVLFVGVVGLGLYLHFKSEPSVWKTEVGDFAMLPRIDETTEKHLHVRWAPTVDFICADNYFILYKKKPADDIYIPASETPLARAQADCSPTDLGYECHADITGLLQNGKSYLYQTYSSQCGDNVDRISVVREYLYSPIGIDAKPVPIQTGS